MNGTLRERIKVQRGWKSMKTPLAEGQRIHYNFVKPHLALQGQTPADAAGVGLNDKNKWLELLQVLVSYRHLWTLLRPVNCRHLGPHLDLVIFQDIGNLLYLLPLPQMLYDRPRDGTLIAANLMVIDADRELRRVFLPFRHGRC